MRNWVWCDRNSQAASQPTRRGTLRYYALGAVFCGFAIAIVPEPAGLVANESTAAICASKLQQFVQELDEVLTANPNSVLVVDAIVQKHLPAAGCNIDDVISISKKSKFFAEAYEQYASYTISFRSQGFIVLFGLRKDTGNIEFPAAKVILPRADERRTEVAPVRRPHDG